ncbi:MAG: type III polyketide synthase [Verrucomicrobiota bacterium]
MASYIQSIGTALPKHRHRQSDLSEHFQAGFDSPTTKRLIRAAFGKSGIEHRFSVLPEFTGGPLYDDSGYAPTDSRMRYYEREAPALALSAATSAFDRVEIDPSEISHLVVVSCTGFTNPGIDLDLVRELGLDNSVERYLIGFMGCYGAFPALRMADQFCRADPQSKVLIVCVELCTLHMQMKDHADAILGNAVFGDGAGAALVTADQPDQSAFKLDWFRSTTLPEGASEMAWSIGNEGFDLVLSSYVPKLIESHISEILAQSGFRPGEIDEWAVHPGGRAILDRFEAATSLPSGSLRASRNVLSAVGNLSSSTILFVLQELLRDAGAGDTIGAVAFGPGLSIETAALTATGSVSVDQAAKTTEDTPLAL